jgi:hypothetical protein
MGTRLLIAAFVIALGFGGYWVGRGIVSTGRENNLGAAEITVTTTAQQKHAATVRRHKRNLQVFEVLVAVGAVYVIVPAIFGIPQRRRRRRAREASARGLT